VLGGLDDGGEGGPVPVVRHDAQCRPFPRRARAQRGQRVGGQRLRVERAAVGPPEEQLAGQPPLELVGGGALAPGHLGHQRRLARIGQHGGFRDVAE
jgi:hypothetical protein